MLTVLRTSWPLLLGMMLLMIGNGVQGTLLGIRGAIEGFSTTQMSVVMSAYFLGFLFGSRMTPNMIRRVGHVRVFAALGSMISAVLVAYAAAPDWIAWSLMRVVIGFSLLGCLYHRRKLAEQRLDERDAGPVSFALHYHADARHHHLAGAAERR